MKVYSLTFNSYCFEYKFYKKHMNIWCQFIFPVLQRQHETLPPDSNPDSNVGWANVGPTSGRQYRRWVNVGPTYIAVWECTWWFLYYFVFIPGFSEIQTWGDPLLCSFYCQQSRPLKLPSDLAWQLREGRICQLVSRQGGSGGSSD